jgi:hypothetical protein
LVQLEGAGERQQLKAGARGRWSFDSSLLPQYALRRRPGIVERRSMDSCAGLPPRAGGPDGQAPSYTSLMAAYRSHMGMGSSSAGTPMSRAASSCQPTVRAPCF